MLLRSCLCIFIFSQLSDILPVLLNFMLFYFNNSIIENIHDDNYYEHMLVQFNNHHQIYNNRIVHYATSFCTFTSLFGLVNNNVYTINLKDFCKILYFTFFLYSSTINKDDNYIIAFKSCLFIFNSLCMVKIFNASSKQYIGLFFTSIIIQELSHIAHNEPALLYNYAGNQYNDVFLHNLFMIPLLHDK